METRFGIFLLVIKMWRFNNTYFQISVVEQAKRHWRIDEMSLRGV